MPGMKELNFDTGLTTFTVNGVCEVSFNPTDLAFSERLFGAFDSLEEMERKYRDQVSKMADRKEIFLFAREIDQDMRAVIDLAFGKPVCDDLFGATNVYAMADGLSIWMNFFFAIMDEVDTAFAREQKATNPRIQKYMAKYKRA